MVVENGSIGIEVGFFNKSYCVFSGLNCELKILKLISFIKMCWKFVNLRKITETVCKYRLIYSSLSILFLIRKFIYITLSLKLATKIIYKTLKKEN